MPERSGSSGFVRFASRVLSGGDTARRHRQEIARATGNGVYTFGRVILKEAPCFYVAKMQYIIKPRDTSSAWCARCVAASVIYRAVGGRHGCEAKEASLTQIWVAVAYGSVYFGPSIRRQSAHHFPG